MLVRAVILLTLAGSVTIRATAQSYPDSFLRWQRHYKEEFLHDARAPLTAEDTGDIRFYPYNWKEHYHFSRVKRTPDVKPFLMATHSGKTKRFRQYGVVTCKPHHGFLGLTPAFMLKGTFKVRIYQSLPDTGDSAKDDVLFLPFYDKTNGTTTYGGGRYIDLRISDIRDGRISIDFNRAYNPWCAYKEGYNCPIPPEENRLTIAIEAGERLYGGRLAE